jgi:LysR family transcriptional regulator, transcriptional activator of nhaA
MEWLNYHHLLYFWTVAREGGLVPAGRVLHLSHPTISAQIRALESELGEKLFTRTGRRLTLTDTGRVVFRYADEIFTLGREMIDTVKGRSTGQPLRFEVGIADVVPKLVVRRLLQPALSLPEPVRLQCYESTFEKLLADLALHSLDVVIADSPVPTGSPIRAFNHLLVETGVSFFGAPPLAKRYRAGFPRSLDGAPFLLPIENLTLRRALNGWFDRNRIRPRVIAEFEDSALLKEFGGDGLGVFPVPALIEKEVTNQFGVQLLGRADDVRERFYAISVQRRLVHPAVVAISEAARADFRGGSRGTVRRRKARAPRRRRQEALITGGD